MHASWRPSWPARLSDWPLALKMGLPAGLSLLGLLVAVTIGGIEQNARTRLLTNLVDRDMWTATQLLQSAADVQGATGRLYRLLALTAGGGDAPALETEITGVTTRIDAVRERLQAVAGQAGTPGRAAAIEAARADLARYRDTVTGVARLLATHSGSAALAAVRPYDSTARSMVVTLSQIADDVQRASTAEAANSVRNAERMRILLAVGSATVVLLVVLCAWAITRRTVLSVQRIARATLLVAQGDKVLDVHKLSRRDELGAIVESLRAFQSNNARVNFLAHHDGLTALPNRVVFHEKLTQAVAHCTQGMRFAVHTLDLDHFKAVNDTLGHPIGDALLQSVAARLTHCVRQGDTVARFGGDEFAIVQVDADGAAGAGKLAQRVIDALSQPYEIDGHQIIIGASIGVAIAPPEGANVDELVSHADMALYRAKAEGRCTWRLYEADMDAALQQRRLLELDMRSALSGGQFELYYQPLVNVQTREVSGFESLIRWHHPERGMVSPNEFIPLAEETGLIVQIGAWVLRQACTDAATWQSNLKVSVNLSPLQFRDSNLVPLVQQTLAAAGLPAWRLELEITEGVLLHDNEATLTTLHKLRALGICISMDDFGTGYSSLSYLRSFPFDKIKIDQSFIRDLAEQPDSVAIVRAVTGLGSSLGIHTTAEGVETEDQLARLVAEGCTEVQGYLFSPPCPAKEVGRMVAEISRRPAVGLIQIKPEALAC
jgi:diguanylate cyclase (GGDEF)-like protein